MPRQKTSRTQRLDWIDLDSERQVRWAINYLVSHSHLPKGIYHHHDAADLLNDLRRKWPPVEAENAQAELIEAKMKAAWRSRLYDLRHKDQKVYGIRMSKEVGEKLKHLTSRDVTVGQAVEDLIRGGLEQAKRIKELQQENRALRQPLSRKKPIEALQSQQQINQLKEKSRVLTCTTKEWQSVCESLALDLARHKVALRAQGLLDARPQLCLSPEEEVKANRLQRQWVKAYSDRVRHAVKTESRKMTTDEEASLSSSTPLSTVRAAPVEQNNTFVATMIAPEKRPDSDNSTATSVPRSTTITTSGTANAPEKAPAPTSDDYMALALKHKVKNQSPNDAE